MISDQIESVLFKNPLYPAASIPCAASKNDRPVLILGRKLFCPLPKRRDRQKGIDTFDMPHAVLHILSYIDQQKVYFAFCSCIQKFLNLFSVYVGLV